MDALIQLLAVLGSVCWIIILALPWQPWRTRERLAPSPDTDVDLNDVTALIPARDEAALIGRTLDALQAQGPGLRAVMVDDQSADGTADAARAVDWQGLTIVPGTPPPAGWSGKLWALDQARRHASTPLLLLLDADIGLEPGTVVALKRKLESERRDLVSVMATLRMESPWERLLMPAFVFFFKLLYPFRLANGDSRWVAAAAGGCILIRAEMLDRLGGFAALRGALIDDCTLARHVKRHGGRTWIGLSHAVRSRRAYDDLATIWAMVARTAFTQLFYSTALLLLCTLLLVATMWGPLLGVAAGGGAVRLLSAFGLVAMVAAYLPTLRYYGRAPFWALLMPVIGSLYLLMTWSSALRYWGGARSTWKGRRYDVADTAATDKLA